MPESTLTQYRRVTTPTPDKHLTWPLYGEGLENLGKNSKPVTREVPQFGPDELLVRNDAVGLCFTDVKEIRLGSKHPRLIGRDLMNDPIVPGHEVSITVVGVGEDLRDQYKIGDRFVIQPDIWYQGKSTPYSFGLDGAYRQYGLIGKEILHGDAGNYMITVPDWMTYAGAALTEPWACVEASYRMTYRTTLQNQGKAWFIGGKNVRQGYKLDKIWDQNHQPAQVWASHLPDDFKNFLKDRCQKENIQFVEQNNLNIIPEEMKFSDIFVLDGTAAEINNAARFLAKFGNLALTSVSPLDAPIEMDMGRLHYDRILYCGTSELDLDAAYQKTPARSTLKPNGTAWILGAGGPLGRMHLQRAIESKNGPSQIIATNRGMIRLAGLRKSFTKLAADQQVELLTFSPREEKEAYLNTMQNILAEGGVDDIEVMAATEVALTEAAKYVGNNGVINLFAGVPRGNIARIDAWLIIGPRQIRFVGYSGSGLDDQITIVKRTIDGQLQPQLAVAAIAGLKQLPECIEAMINKVHPGKIVMFPSIEDFPLTSLSDLENVLPEIYRYLGEGNVWTKEAEDAFLETMLARQQ